MKKLLFALLALPTFSHAGTLRFDFATLGQIIISSGTPIASASIAFDSATTNEMTGSTTRTWSQTCNNCSFIACGTAALNDAAVTSITYAGVNLTRGHAFTDPFGPTRAEIWHSTFTPTTGTNNVVVTFPSAVQAGLGCITLTGTEVSQTNIDVSTGSMAGAGTAVQSSTATTTQDGDWAFSVTVQNDVTTLTSASGQTTQMGTNDLITGFGGWIGSTKGPLSTGTNYMTQLTSTWAQPAQAVIFIKKAP